MKYKTPFSTRLAGLLVLAMLVLAACQPAATPTTAPIATVAPKAASNGSVPSTGGNSSTPSASTSSEATINLVTVPGVGKYLVDSRCMTLYIYTTDTADTSTCTGGCAKAWPPFTPTGSVTSGPGIDQSLIGTATLADGSKIVTWNHMPLYYFAKDQKPGDITGQGVGGVWFIVGPRGNVMKRSGSPNSSGSPAAASSNAMVNVANNATLGQILVDGKGMTLYIFTKDVPDQSNCTGGCLKAWPPFLTTGSVTAGSGVQQSMLGTVTLADGSKIVTYNHMPLYYLASDTKLGDATGQGVQNVWYVVSPDGKPVMTATK
jgi:predicted lipoprotein with Yx(FWY)xxD motif